MGGEGGATLWEGAGGATLWDFSSHITTDSNTTLTNSHSSTSMLRISGRVGTTEWHSALFSIILFPIRYPTRLSTRRTGYVLGEYCIVITVYIKNRVCTGRVLYCDNGIH